MLLSINSFIFVTLLCVNLLAAAQGASKWVADYPNVKQIPKKWSFKSTNGNVGYTEDYYWMENANETDKDLQKFLSQQSILTESYLRQCTNRDAISKSIHDANLYASISFAGLFGEDLNKPIYVYSYFGPVDQRASWYVASLDEFHGAEKSNFNTPPGKYFLNESLLSSDQSSNILQATVSPDTKIFAYLTTDNTNSATWFFRSLDSPLIKAETMPSGGEGRFPLAIPYCYASLQWLNDSSGFFYEQGQDDKGGTVLDHGEKVRYHKWGTDSGQDITVFDAHNLGIDSNSTYFFPYLTDDDRWLFVLSYQNLDAKMRTYATFLPGQKISETMKWISIAPDNDFTMFPITVLDDWFYFETDYQAENLKVVKMKLDWSKAKTVQRFNELQDRPKMIDVIDERKDASFSPTHTSVFPFAHDKAILIYYENGQNTIYIHDLLSGKKLQQVLQDEKSSDAFITSNGQSDYAQLTLSSFDTPEKVYEFKFDEKEGKVKTSLVSYQSIAGTTPNDFQVEELYATSKDGVQIPYFVTSRKGTVKPGPVRMHSYANYGYVQNLFYDASYFAWLNDYNGFFVWAALRGGGDKGGAWHRAAEGIHKQRTMDDLIACAEDLVKRNITTEGQIILESDSGGAMLIAAAINQARDGLIGATLLERPALDVFQLELRTSVGGNNLLEFGNVKNESEVQSVLAWSPLHNINPKKSYPAILSTPGALDTRVPSSNTYKYLAQMQFTHPNSSTPSLMYVVPKSGHLFSGSTTDEYILEKTQQTCFVELALGLKRRKV